MFQLFTVFIDRDFAFGFAILEIAYRDFNRALLRLTKCSQQWYFSVLYFNFMW